MGEMKIKIKNYYLRNIIVSSFELLSSREAVPKFD